MLSTYHRCKRVCFLSSWILSSFYWTRTEQNAKDVASWAAVGAAILRPSNPCTVTFFLFSVPLPPLLLLLLCLIDPPAALCTMEYIDTYIQLRRITFLPNGTYTRPYRRPKFELYPETHATTHTILLHTAKNSAQRLSTLYWRVDDP